MTRSKAAITAWSSFGLGCVMLVAAIWFSVAANPYRPADSRVRTLDVIWALSILSIPLAGPFLASRQPSNPIGWLLCTLGLGLTVGLAGSEYAHYAQSVPNNDLVAADWIMWLSNIAFDAAVASLGLTLLLIPNGKLPSPRWRWIARVLVLGTALSMGGQAFAPGRFEGTGSPINQLGIQGADFLGTVSDIGFAVLALTTLAGALSPIVRFRRSTGEVRQQLKWFALAAGLFVVLLAASTSLEALSPDLEELSTAIFILSVLSLAGGLAVSVLKYRLYDIDLVVNRTIVYLLLSLLLGLIYFGGVTLFQGMIGIGSGSDLAVAASTLAVAGLFHPARRRIQSFIDHYFYRRKYDAQRTIDDFSNKLRDEIDLNSLNTELVDVVSRTMQPTHVSVWLPRWEGDA